MTTRYVTRTKQRNQNVAISSAERLQLAVRKGLKSVLLLPMKTGSPQILPSDSDGSHSPNSGIMDSEPQNMPRQQISDLPPAPPTGQGEATGGSNLPLTGNLSDGDVLQEKTTVDGDDDLTSRDGRTTPPSSPGSENTVIGGRNSLHNSNDQLNSEISFNRNVVEPGRLQEFIDENISESQFHSGEQIPNLTEQREREAMEQQQRELELIQRENMARLSLLSTGPVSQLGLPGRPSGMPQVQSAFSSSQVVNHGQQEGLNVAVLNTATTVSWTPTSQTQPRVTLSSASCVPTSTQSSQGPGIPTLSDLLLQ